MFRRCSPATTTRSISIARSMPASPLSTPTRERSALNAEQARVLERYHTRFVRAGAALEKPAQERLAAINERLASLGTQFGQNVLADEKSFAMILGRERSRRAARLRPRGGPCRRRGARSTRQICHYPGALLDRALSAILVASRSARKGFPGLDQARRKRRGDRQSRARSPKWLRCAANGPGCWALLASPTTGSMIRWPRLRRRRAGFSTRSGAGRARRPPPSGTRLQALIAKEGGNFALGAARLALLCREASQGEI